MNYTLAELEDELYLRLKAQSSLHDFVKLFWPEIEGGRKFLDNWHIQAICEHLEALAKGQIQNLLINIPPRCSKTNLVSVMWPAWVWTTKPETQFLLASYSIDISRTSTVKTRRIISSELYQLTWGVSIQADQNTKTRFDNTETGHYIASSVGGSLTGLGGDFLIADDLNNAAEAQSEVIRKSTNDWWSSVWSTRLNNPENGGRVLIQQRLHESDVSGHVIARDNENLWTKLILPMEFESSKRAKTIILPSTQGQRWQDPRKQEGELLWPARFSAAKMEEKKRELGSYAYAGMFQQRPSPAEGGIIKKSWFQWWKNTKVPKLEYVIQSWDTALETKEINNYSACITIGVFADEHEIYNAILLSAWRGRVDYPTLRRYAKRLYADYRDDLSEEFEQTPQSRFVPDTVLIEAKVSGISLVQDLIDARIPATRFNPTKYGDKLQRVQLISHLIENGRFWVPAQPSYYEKLLPFADMFVEACALFPNGDSRDIVDTLSQAMIRLKHSGWLKNSADRNKEEEAEWDY